MRWGEMLAVVWPLSCAGCGRPGWSWCDRCRATAEPADPDDVPPGAWAALRFDGSVRRAILALKYGGRRGVAAALATHVITIIPPGEPPEVVTWVPTSPRRARTRGYDLAELIARALARHLHRPCRRLLRRLPGPPQTGRSRDDRLAGPAFVARPASRPRRVLLVDDVVTTGASLAAASRALAGAGAATVVCVAVAATPPGGGASDGPGGRR